MTDSRVGPIIGQETRLKRSAGMQLFAALIPLVLFWAVEEFLGLKAALIAGCVAAIFEVGWEWRRQGRVSFLTWASNGLVLGLGAVSYVMDSGIAFKLQPAVLEWGTAIMMAGSRFGSGEPFMLRSFREAPVLDAEKREAALKTPFFEAKLRAMDSRLIVFLILHGLAVAWAAIWGSSRLWILLKGVLFYVLLVLVMAPMYRRGHGNHPAASSEI